MPMMIRYDRPAGTPGPGCLTVLRYSPAWHGAAACVGSCRTPESGSPGTVTRTRDRRPGPVHGLVTSDQFPGSPAGSWALAGDAG
eukprot:575570-Hanusia_phi.AAC.2